MQTTQSQQLEYIATRHGTPVYVYNMGIIRKRVQELQHFLGAFEETDIFYAIKANYNPTLARRIIALGLGIDAVSPEEAELALACGADPKRVLYTENNMTDEEMHRVHALGILMNIGSLSRLRKFGAAYPGSRVCVRINPEIGAASHATNITASSHSKFGIPIKALDDIFAIVRAHDLRIIGVHQHVGSGWLDIDTPLQAFDIFLESIGRFDHLDFVDFGGGFGVPYRPEEKPLDMQTLGRRIAERFTRFRAQRNDRPRLRFEPGRYVVAESGRLLTRVNTIKHAPDGRTIVGTDTGMNHLIRPALYDAYHPVENISNPHGRSHTYDITGNICESADFFAKERAVSEIREGDLLSINIAGAYGMSMASNYQFRSLPAEVLIDGDEITCIRPRRTCKEMLHILYS